MVEVGVKAQISKADAVFERVGANYDIAISAVDHEQIHREPSQNPCKQSTQANRKLTKTDRNGRFSFRTIVPSEYPGRTPHIHMKLWSEGNNFLTTQLYIHDHPQNKKDFLFQQMSLAEQRINSMKLIPATDKNTAEFQTFVKIVV